MFISSCGVSGIDFYSAAVKLDIIEASNLSDAAKHTSIFVKRIQLLVPWRRLGRQHVDKEAMLTNHAREEILCSQSIGAILTPFVYFFLSGQRPLIHILHLTISKTSSIS